MADEAQRLARLLQTIDQEKASKKQFVKAANDNIKRLEAEAREFAAAIESGSKELF